MARYRCSKSNNYGAKKTKVSYKGKILLIDSKLEAGVAKELIALERVGKIRCLQFQPQFELMEGFTVFSTAVKSGKSKQSNVKYTPDFAYVDEFNRLVVIEAKGFASEAYKLRRRIFLYLMRDLGVDVFIERYAKKTIEYKPYTK